MVTHFFLHTSLIVQNKQDLPSLILSEVNGQSLLSLMLSRLKKLSTIQRINIVTSDSIKDNPIIKHVAKIIQCDEWEKFKIIRINTSSPYQFSEANRLIGRDFLHKQPVYGFYNAQCLNEYCASHQIDIAVLATADDIPLIGPEVIDKIVTRYSENGISYGTRNPGQRIIVIPVSELHSRVSVCAYNRKKKLAENTEKIKDNILALHETNPSIETSYIQKIQLDSITKFYSRAISCDDILSQINENGYSQQALMVENYQFFPIHRQCDKDVIKKLFFIKGKETYADRIETKNRIQEMSNILAPVTLEIELTNRTNSICENMPLPPLSYPPKEMDFHVYRDIVNTFCNIVPYIVLSGYGEPTLHSDFLAYIRYAKEQNFLRVCVETNGIMLHDCQVIRNILTTGLDILIVNLDQFDRYALNADKNALYSSDAIIEKLLHIRSELGQSKPYIIVQAMNRVSNQRDINYYYNRWINIVDAVVIQPFNDYRNLLDSTERINLVPTSTPVNCFKTTQVLYVLANGKPVLCKQKTDGFQPSTKKNLHEIWLDNYIRGGTFDFCKECVYKYYREGMQPEKFASSLNYYIQESIQTETANELLKLAELNFKNGEYGKAITMWQSILQMYPDHTQVLRKLDNLYATLPNI